MKFNKKWSLFLLATFVSFFGIINVFLKGTESANVDLDVAKQREALIATADAYYNQGKQLQYDSFRKNLYATPEDATSQHPVYTVCSGVIFQSYYQTFGIKLPDETATLLDYAEKNKDNKSVVLRYYGSTSEIYNDDVIGTKGNPNYENLFNEWINILQPGDIFVFTGHAMLIHSIDKKNGVVNILDACEGDKYDYGNYKEVYELKGTLSKGDYLADGTKHLNNLKQKLYVRYNNMNISNKMVSRMAIIRIINDDMTYIDKDNKEVSYSVSDASLSRVKYPHIDVGKVVSVSDGSKTISYNILADLGDTITYELTIRNKSNVNYSAFDVVENIDERLEIIDKGDGVLSDKQLKWTVSSLKSGDYVKFKYTVKVPNDKSLLGKIIVSTGFVDDIANSKIETLIGNKFSQEEEQKLISTFSDLEDDAKNKQVERQFINQIYYDAFDLDLGISDLSNLDIIGYDGSLTSSGKDKVVVKRTKVKDASVGKYIYHNFYGLTTYDKNCADVNVVRIHSAWNLYPISEINDKVRSISSKQLLNGDIILVREEKLKKVEDATCPVIESYVEKSYIFINGELIRKKSTTEFEKISGDDLTIFLRNIIGKNFIVLRPSIAMFEDDENVSDGDYSVNFDNSLTIDNENKFIKYLTLNTTFDMLLDNIDIVNGIIKLFDFSGNEKDNDKKLATGDVLKIYSNNELKDEYIISVIGDSSGDRLLDLIDLSHMRKHIVGWLNPNTNKIQYQTGVNYYALDFNKDNIIDLIDLSKMRKIIVGIDE